jgi:hypothetical protein
MSKYQEIAEEIKVNSLGIVGIAKIVWQVSSKRREFPSKKDSCGHLILL